MLLRPHWIYVILLAPAVCLAVQGGEPADTALPETVPLLSRDDEAAALVRFEREIWPLLTRGEARNSCVGCHDERSKSELRYYVDGESADVQSNFRMLLTHGYLDPENPDSILARVSSTKKGRRMPPGRRSAWSPEEIKRLKSFAGDITLKRRERGAGPEAGNADEQFPLELLAPYAGSAPGQLDNTFLSYLQLKGKVRTIFNDDWHRGGRDLFDENIALFGGANFRTRFSESSTASVAFLSALDLLARDVATKAYIHRTGPFAGHPRDLPSPLDETEPNDAYRQQIERLYQTILFRDPTVDEIDVAYQLLREVFRAEAEIGNLDYDLTIELTVEEDLHGLTTVHEISIPVHAGDIGLLQTYIDQSVDVPEEVAGQKLEGLFTLRPDDPRQYFRVTNRGRRGNVSFHALKLRLQGADGRPAEEPILLTVDDPEVLTEGTWSFSKGKEFSSYEVNSDTGIESTLTMGIDVPADGAYEVTVLWRKNKDNSKAVLIELASHDDSRLDLPALSPVPPPGEVRYHVNQSDDAVDFWDIDNYFQFAPNDYVEINNEGTTGRVVADAMKFLPFGGGGDELLVDNHEADGKEDWTVYKKEGPSIFNRVGPDVYFDENKRKGELALRYRPAVKENWNPASFYRLRVGNPGRANHETRTPVVVRATASTPIVQVARPTRAAVGAAVRLDASASFVLQSAGLSFRWRQEGGAEVDLQPSPDDEQRDAIVTFRMPALGVTQAAWVSLCRALVNHPDFLFTRPPSVATTKDPAAKRRLQLMKIALDLVGRPPTRAELYELKGGMALPGLIDHYLRSKDFEEFYFHRIRLYLESHGSPVQDEPVRLWCYVAFNDLPFKEILTADYTVDVDFEKRMRPAHHGRSGILTTAGFIEGKPGLPHFNYSAQVAEKFLGYVFEVPDSVVEERESITAISTTSPESVCYSCHKLLTPLAYQRLKWDDRGQYRTKDDKGKALDDSDRGLVRSYPFRGNGMEAFATRAVHKERFIRTIIDAHFILFFGREMRYRKDERLLYREIWKTVHADQFTIRGLIKSILTSPEYLEGQPRRGSHSE